MVAEKSEKSAELRKIVLLALALAIATAVLYLPALRNGFVSFDDPDYVTRNGHVQQGLTLANVKWGVWDGKSGVELASADVDVAHAGCRFVRRAGVWASPDKCIAAGRGRRASVSAVCSGDRGSDEKRGCGSAFRGASDECGSGGVGSGAENSALHGLFSGSVLRLRLVHEKARAWALRVGCGVVCAGVAFEGDGDDASASAFAAGLLAAAEDGRQRRGGRGRLLGRRRCGWAWKRCRCC